MEARLALAGPSGRTGRRHRTAAAGEEGAGHRDRDPEGHVGAVGEKSRAQTRKSPASREKTLLVKTAGETLDVTAKSLLPVVGHRAQHVPLQPDAMKRPDKDSGLLELVREAFGNGKRRYGYRRIHLELKGMGIVASAKRIMRLMTGHGLAPLFKSAKRYSSYKGEPDKAPANLVDRDFHAERPNTLWVTDLTEFSIPAGKAYLSPVIDCRHAGRLNDRHQPGLGVGQRHARRRMLHAQGRRETNHPFRPWLPLLVARVDPHPQGQQPDAFDGRERLFSGQRRRGRVLRPSQAGVLPQAQLRERLDGRVHRDARRLHGPVPGQEDQNGVRHEHHGPSTRARSCGMIGGDGINDESNKTAPAPSDRHFYTFWYPLLEIGDPAKHHHLQNPSASFSMLHQRPSLNKKDQ